MIIIFWLIINPSGEIILSVYIPVVNVLTFSFIWFSPLLRPKFSLYTSWPLKL